MPSPERHQRRAARFSVATTLASRLPCAVWGIAFAALLAIGGQAQTAPAPVLPPSASLPVASAGALAPAAPLSRFDVVTGMQTDVLFGRNTPGPYPLSWKHARTNSETVECNGRLLQRDIDYTVDYAAGTLRFAFPLQPSATVRITYAADTPDAVRALPGAQPLNWDILQNGANRLRLRTLVRDESDPSTWLLSRSGADPNAAAFGSNALQWTGSMPLLRSSFLRTQLDTKLFMDMQGGDWLQRGGLAVGEKTHWGRTDFSLTYQRAGALFTQSEESGLATGQQVFGAAFGLTPAKGLSVTGSVQQITRLPDATTSVAGSSTTAAPSALPTFDTALLTKGSLALQVPQLARTKLSASLEDRYDKDGAHRNGEASVQLPRLPFAQTQITGGVQVTSNPGQERTVGLLSASAKPLRYFEIAGDARVRNGQLADAKPDPDAVNTFGLKLNFAPSKRLKLTGSAIRNPEADGAIKRVLRHALGLESDWGNVALRGQFGLDEEETTARLSGASEFGLDLHLTRFDVFSTGFRGQGLFDRVTPGVGTYLLGFTHRLGTAFDLNLNGSLSRPLFGSDPAKSEIKTEARLGVHF